jgi:hypothetical protein
MDYFVVCASLYMHFLVWILFGVYYRDSIYDMLKQKENMWKTIVRKKLTKKNYGLLNELKWAIFS